MRCKMVMTIPLSGVSRGQRCNNGGLRCTPYKEYGVWGKEVNKGALSFFFQRSEKDLDT